MKKWIIGFLSPAVLAPLLWKCPALYSWLFLEVTLSIWQIIAAFISLLILVFAIRYWIYAINSQFPIGMQVKRYGFYQAYVVTGYHFFYPKIIYIKDIDKHTTLGVNCETIYRFCPSSS